MANEELNQETSQAPDFMTALQQAPPNQPTAEDAEAQKAALSAQAASQVSNAVNAPKANFDMAGLANAAPKTEGPAPGSIAWRLTNALKSPGAQKGGGGTLALFGSVTDALLHGNPEESGQAAQTAAATPGSGSDAWSAAQSNADATRSTTAPIAAPRKNFIDTLLAQVGDVAAASKERSVLGGFAKAAAAGTQREREEQADRVALAHSNSQMLHEQALTHKMGEDAINASAATGKQGSSAILTAHIPGQLIAEGKTSDEIKQMIDSGEIKPTEQTVFLTGRRMTGTDANGQPMFRSTYTVVKPGGPVDLSDREDEVKFIRDNTGVDLKAENGKVTQIPAVQFNQLWQQASNASILKRAAQVKGAQDNKVINESQNSEAAKQMIKSPTLLNAMSGHTSVTKQGMEDPFAVAKTYNYVMNNPKIRAQIEKETGAPSFSDSYTKYAGGEKRLNKSLQDYTKAQEKNKNTISDMLVEAKSNPAKMEGKSSSYIAAANSVLNAPKNSPDITDADRKNAADVLAVANDVRQQEIDFEKDKAAGKKEAEVGFQGNPDATSPEAFFSSLKPGEQELVKQMGTGKMPILRIEYLAARKPELLEAVSKSYPGFDAAKVKSYVDTYKSFTSGEVSKILDAGGTALGHLRELKNLNTAASHIPHTPAWTAYQNKVDTVAGELAKFYGNVTIPAIDAIKETLASTLPGNRESAIRTQAQSMGDKLDSQETKWKNAAPSDAYQAQMPDISPNAKRARAELDPNYALSHPELAGEKSPSSAAKAPAGATHKVPGPDGKMHWTNDKGTVDYGVVQ